MIKITMSENSLPLHADEIELILSLLSEKAKGIDQFFNERQALMNEIEQMIDKVVPETRKALESEIQGIDASFDHMKRDFREIENIYDRIATAHGVPGLKTVVFGEDQSSIKDESLPF